MTQLRVSSNPISWFPEDHPFRIASDYITDTFGGSRNLELVIDVGAENGLHEPETMNRIESLDRLVADLRESGAALTHTASVVDIVKETHQALNANDAAFYAIPQERMLLAQELLLFENGGSDDLEKVVDSSFSKARYSIRITWEDGADTANFLEESEHRFHEAVGPDAKLLITGMAAVIARTVAATRDSMLRSYALALALITPLMIILIGSLRAGLVSMVPNLVPILLTLGMMALVGIPIDMFTLLAGCIAIGLAVDDSIHFISSFRRYLASSHDPIDAVEKTMQSTGRALLFTSIVLTTGFLVLTLSAMLNLRQVGALTAFAVAAAFLLDVTVTPALLVLTHRKRHAVSTSADLRI
jgi:predicted RND superfamily exporter protein